MNTIPTVTKNLLIINVLMFLGTIVAQSYGIDLAQYLGLHFFLAEDFNAAQLITYMFMHAGFAHIFFNGSVHPEIYLRAICRSLACRIWLSVLDQSISRILSC